MTPSEHRCRNVCVSVLQTFPFFGVVPAVLNESGEELEGPCEGYLVRDGQRALRRENTVLFVTRVTPSQVFKQPWPGVMRTVYGNHQRFETTYFKKFPGYYVTGDGERGSSSFEQRQCLSFVNSGQQRPLQLLKQN